MKQNHMVSLELKNHGKILIQLSIKLLDENDPFHNVPISCFI